MPIERGFGVELQWSVACTSVCTEPSAPLCGVTCSVARVRLLPRGRLMLVSPPKLSSTDRPCRSVSAPEATTTAATPGGGGGGAA